MIRTIKWGKYSVEVFLKFGFCKYLIHTIKNLAYSCKKLP